MSEITKPHVADAMRGKPSFAKATEGEQVKGKISQVIGAVVNVKFDSQKDLPSVKSE